MWRTYITLLVLSSFRTIDCDVELKIFRVIDENSSLVTLGLEEQAGNNLTLTCDLISTAFSDDQIIWGKATPDFNFKNKTDLEQLANKKSKKLYSMVRQSELNRAQKRFTPLKPEDGGTYFCGSLKFMKFAVVYIVVKDVAVRHPAADQAYRTNLFVDGNFYCNEKMFKCKSNSACISQHYVCDKKPDCTDGSDESIETCKGDPCKDKLQCDDGRCIPMYWCCDKYHDHGCNVTYKPSCCQLLPETYEELEYGYTYNMTEVRTNRTSYIFVSLCILATVFSIVLMLLILSKVFLFAKKTTMCPRSGPDIFQLEERGRQYRGYTAYNYRGPVERENDVANGTVDALLILSDEIIRYGDGGGDRPPSYSDVMGQPEPPPPYTSQDCLNRS